MAQTFDIPIDVPWTLVAASPDMMDTTFADFGFPTPWRSSLAIYAYEPSAKDMPPQLCNQKVTYLKVTCSITGFQPTAQEVLELRALTQHQKEGIDVAVVLPNVAGNRDSSSSHRIPGSVGTAPDGTVIRGVLPLLY